MTENMDSGDAKMMTNISDLLQIKEDIANMSLKIIEESQSRQENQIIQDLSKDNNGISSLPILPSPPSSFNVHNNAVQEGGEDVVLSNLDTQDAKGFCWGTGESSTSSSDTGTKAVHPAMPVHMDSEVYNMNHPKRGRAVIFNHENFNPQLELGRRLGTEKDKQNLKHTLANLGFEVDYHDDLTYHELVREIEALTKQDHKEHDCLVIAVLSHGDTHLMYAKDYSYKPDMLWQSFTADRVPSLAGKPKLFFIQACQGSQLDEGTKLVRVSRTEVDSSPQSYRIPNHADFLICYSTFPGFYAWRNTTNGSWFIQAVCGVLTKHASKKDVLAMMTIVCREVALYFESNTPSQPHMHQRKQIPFITSTLIRDCFFIPKPK